MPSPSTSKCQNNPLPTFVLMVPTIRALAKLLMGGNAIRAEGGKALAEALKDNQVMQELNISSNKLGENSSYDSDMSGVIAISDAIPTMGALTSLNVSNNNFTDYGRDMSGVKALAAAIPECK